MIFNLKCVISIEKMKTNNIFDIYIKMKINDKKLRLLKGEKYDIGNTLLFQRI